MMDPGSIDAVIPAKAGISDFSFSHANVAKAALHEQPGLAFDPGKRRAWNDPRYTRPSGSCIVMQCRLPFCQINGRQGTATISRSGKAFSSTAAAAASAASP